MTKPIDPYSRVYWRVLDDERFDSIRSDMRHFGSWTLMLLVADMAYPAPAFVPSTVPKASVTALVSVGLIEALPGGLYRVHGLAAERSRRWSPRGPDGTPTGAEGEPERPAKVPARSLARATAETRLDETSKAETDTSRASGDLDEDEVPVFAYLSQHGAFVRPDSPLGRRLLGVIGRQGGEAVLKEAIRLAKSAPVMSDRQWVLGLENAIEQIPTGKVPMDEIVAEAQEQRSTAIYDRMMARRIEWYRQTGKWDEGWGAMPAEVTA